MASDEIPIQWRDDLLDTLRQAELKPASTYIVQGDLSPSLHPVFSHDTANFVELTEGRSRRPELEIELGERALKYLIQEEFAISTRRVLADLLGKNGIQQTGLRLVQSGLQERE